MMNATQSALGWLCSDRKAVFRETGFSCTDQSAWNTISQSLEYG